MTQLLRWHSVHKAVVVLVIAAVLAGCSAPTTPHGSGKIGGSAMNPSGEAYANARVTLNPGSLVKTTDAGGSFLFANLTAGTYILHFEPVNAAAFDQTVKLLSDDQAIVGMMFMADGT